MYDRWWTRRDPRTRAAVGGRMEEADVANANDCELSDVRYMVIRQCVEKTDVAESRDNARGGGV